MTERTALESEARVEWRMDNDIVARMTAEDRTWLKFTTFCNRVMKSLQHKEKEIEKWIIQKKKKESDLKQR